MYPACIEPLFWISFSNCAECQSRFLIQIHCSVNTYLLSSTTEEWINCSCQFLFYHTQRRTVAHTYEISKLFINRRVRISCKGVVWKSCAKYSVRWLWVFVPWLDTNHFNCSDRSIQFSWLKNGIVTKTQRSVRLFDRIPLNFLLNTFRVFKGYFAFVFFTLAS